MNFVACRTGWEWVSTLSNLEGISVHVKQKAQQRQETIQVRVKLKLWAALQERPKNRLDLNTKYVTVWNGLDLYLNDWHWMTAPAWEHQEWPHSTRAWHSPRLLSLLLMTTTLLLCRVHMCDWVVKSCANDNEPVSYRYSSYGRLCGPFAQRVQEKWHLEQSYLNLTSCVPYFAAKHNIISTP